MLVLDNDLHIFFKILFHTGPFENSEINRLDLEGGLLKVDFYNNFGPYIKIQYISNQTNIEKLVSEFVVSNVLGLLLFVYLELVCLRYVMSSYGLSVLGLIYIYIYIQYHVFVLFSCLFILEENIYTFIFKVNYRFSLGKIASKIFSSTYECPSRPGEESKKYLKRNKKIHGKNFASK